MHFNFSVPRWRYVFPLRSFRDTQDSSELLISVMLKIHNVCNSLVYQLSPVGPGFDFIHLTASFHLIQCSGASI